MNKDIDTDIKKVDEIQDSLVQKWIKVADAETPNNAELKGQALEKIGNKLVKITDQLDEIKIEPTAASPKLSAAHEGVLGEVE